MYRRLDDGRLSLELFAFCHAASLGESAATRKAWARSLAVIILLWHFRVAALEPLSGSSGEWRGRGHLKAKGGVGDEYIHLTPSNYGSIVKRIAADERRLILTTLSISYRGQNNSENQLDHMRNFAYHLHKLNRLENTLIISYETETCATLLSESIPCFVDQVATRPDELPSRLQEETAHFLKYWHALALLKLGITVFFSDSDAAILQDPFLYQDLHYDIEGLSDWNWLSRLPTTRDMADHPCAVYSSKKDNAVRGGQYVEGSFSVNQSDARVQRHNSPCQSTGAWFAAPTRPAISFLEDLLDRMTVSHPEQWDQAAWNELIVLHLYGMGPKPPLAYRLLPVESFNNLETHTRRTEENLPLNLVVLHAGGFSGQDKIDLLIRKGFWKAQYWRPVWGTKLMQRFPI